MGELVCRTVSEGPVDRLLRTLSGLSSRGTVQDPLQVACRCPGGLRACDDGGVFEGTSRDLLRIPVKRDDS